MNTRSGRLGFTLVELVAVIISVCLLAALILPALQSARTPSRRNTCLNNIRQISLALLIHEETSRSYPLASTTYFDSGGQHIGTVGTEEDGYSWLFQILPHIEQGTLYDRARNSDEQIGADGVLGKGSQRLQQGPFVPMVVVDPHASGSYGSLSRTYIEAFLCPSFPGSDETRNPIYAGEPAAVGNYVAIPSTHYLADSTNHEFGEDLLHPSRCLYSSSKSSVTRRLIGNGVLVFAQRPNGLSHDENDLPLRSIFQPISGHLKPRGITAASLRDGASNTIVFAESREERYASWISGLSAYVVAADPRGPGNGIGLLPAEGDSNRQVLGWADDDPAGQTALNVGSMARRCGGDQATEGPDCSGQSPRTARFYDHRFVHAGVAGPMAKRWYGPSSAHPGIVQHGFADGHGAPIVEDIDRNVYLHLVTRAGMEEVDEFAY